MTQVFLMTDVVGSTAMWERFTDDMPGLLARHDELVHGAVSAAGGTVFKHTGDGMIAVFDEPDDAIAAAVQANAALAAADWSPAGELLVRSSVHAGPATERDGDYFGPALNRVARVNGVAHPGQILVSGAARALMRSPSGIDLGDHQLRDLGELVRLWQLDDGVHPPPVSLQSGMHNLPVQMSEFIGRHTEVVQLTKLLVDYRLVSITGVGGCGKTRIALEVAATVIDRFPGGVWFADLRSADDQAQVIRQIAVAIGLVTGGESDSDGDLSDLIIEYVSREPTLIVLDNCEHLVDDAADVAADLLQSADSLTMLATSREALATEGERVWRIPSLGTTSGEARELFIARAMANSSDFELLHGDEQIVDQICAQLDGIPLAIELAAGRVAHMSLAELNERLDERFSLLSGGRRARRQRQQTLQAMMDWSWDLLDPDEQSMLAEVAVFRGGFDREGVEAVCSAPSQGSRFEVLTSLVDRSLVVTAPGDHTTSRYQLLETVRLYGLDRLAARGDIDVVRDRHGEWVRGSNSCRLTGSLMISASGTNLVPDRYAEANVDNVLSALDWFARVDDVVSVAEIAAGRPALFVAEHNVDGVRWLTRELVERPELPYDIRVAVCAGAALVAIFAGDYESAHQFGVTGKQLIEAAGPDRDVRGRPWEAQIYSHASNLALGAGDLDAARRDYERGVEVWPGSEEQFLGFAITGGLLAFADGDPRLAEQVTRPTPLEVADPSFPGVGVKIMVNAMALSMLARHDEAIEIASLLVDQTKLGSTPIATGIMQMAWVFQRAGDTQRALELIGRPPRLAVGKAVDHWRLGRVLLLAEYFIDSEPELAAQLVGSVDPVRVITLGMRRNELLHGLRDRLGERLDELLAAGRRDGDEVVVARAHELLTEAGLHP